MAMVTGFGGAFLRADDPVALYAWYERHFGIKNADGALLFSKETQGERVAVAFFARNDNYFPVSQPAMLNFQVDDLDALMDRLEENGVSVETKRERSEYGIFGWIMDLEGNRIELWQPPPS